MSVGQTTKTPPGSPKILRLSDEIGETNSPYQALSLPLAGQQDITICTYFKTRISVPIEIALFDGNGTLIGFFQALSAALAKKRYDIVHAHSPHVALFFLITCLFGHRDLLRSTVYTVHSSYSRYKLRNKLLLIPIIVFFARVVCCSNSSLRSFPRVLRWLVGKRICVVPNGVSLDRIDHVISEYPKVASEKLFTVVSVGRLIELKRPMTLLKAFQQAANGNTNLVFIGDGYLRARLISDSKALGLTKHVDFTGLIPREEVYARLGQADVSISTSRIEGLPIAVLEAMACRCPVILSDIPSHREIAGTADFIPLVQVDDIDGFAQEIRRFQSMSASERWGVGARCRELVKERFSLSSTHSGYEKVYNELVGANGRRNSKRAYAS